MADPGKMYGETGTLAHGGTSAGTIADHIDEIRGTLAASVAQLKAWWDGQAARACETSFAGWDADAMVLVSMLRDLGVDTVFASNAYDAADEIGASKLNAVPGTTIRDGLQP
jgi:WXG100 family type VII secretion target